MVTQYYKVVFDLYLRKKEVPYSNPEKWLPPISPCPVPCLT